MAKIPPPRYINIYERACPTPEAADRIIPGNRQEWTPEEDAILREFYPTEGFAVVSRLPGRTEYACQSRAHTLELDLL